MFTGIIEERGSVRAVHWQAGMARLTVDAHLVARDLAPGDSVAVNGVCLTAAEVTASGFCADVMGETVRRSALGRLEVGARVNLERAVTPQTRLGGHLVQGHVDGTGLLLTRRSEPAGTVLRIGLPAALARYVVAQGSITVDGISLTVSGIGPDWFEVSLIPTTLAVTTLGDLPVGAAVNLEVDVVAKYVEKLLESRR